MAIHNAQSHTTGYVTEEIKHVSLYNSFVLEHSMYESGWAAMLQMPKCIIALNILIVNWIVKLLIYYEHDPVKSGCAGLWSTNRKHIVQFIYNNVYLTFLLREIFGIRKKVTLYDIVLLCCAIYTFEVHDLSWNLFFMITCCDILN